MGMARLLAKGWLVFCLFAGIYSLRIVLIRGETTQQAIDDVVVPVALFAAMGALFVAGYAALGDAAAWRAGPFRRQFLPGFNELVFAAFAVASFANQVFVAPVQMGRPVATAVSGAVAALVPGQRALEDQLSCGLDGGRVFSSAFAWILALIFLASAASRLRLTVGLMRLERASRPEVLGAVPLALVLGLLAILGVQLLFVGSVYPLLPCAAFNDISGAILIGLAPLMLAYLVVAALAAA
ncbi:MAG: hypothetical protein JOZ55_05650, partial [Alphaproteobacteria bacterium]|nr:hypothetical protein [Alphaproteobacteria bacterium]